VSAQTTVSTVFVGVREWAVKIESKLYLGGYRNVVVGVWSVRALAERPLNIYSVQVGKCRSAASDTNRAAGRGAPLLQLICCVTKEYS
jgi:hypothetical protein